MTIILLLIAAVAIYFFLKKKSGLPSGPVASRQQVTAPLRGVPHHWQDTQSFDFQVVGENYYQTHLTAVVGQHGDEYIRIRKVATIVPEDDNPHDDKAVAIHIDGAKVGHLSREEARSFRRRLGAKKMSGQITTCDAEVRGGKVQNGRRSSYEVYLAIKQFSF